ncbi:MAG: response regulator [Limnospira sp.]
MLSVLLLEDDPVDVELIHTVLTNAGIECRWMCVENQDEFVRSLSAEKYDLILADYALPAFDGISALQITREIDPEMPFILVSGQLGEEQAIDALKLGATDYVLKRRLSRLPLAVERAMRETRERVNRQRAEEALRRSEEKYRQIVETAREGIWMIDRDSSTIYANAQMAEMLGYTAEEISRGSPTECVALADIPEANRLCESTRRGAAGQHELCLPRRDGGGVWTLISTNPIRDEGGECVATLAMVTDISDRKQAEQKLAQLLVHAQRQTVILQQAKETADAANRAKSEFLARMSHELRTPLNSILGFTQLMLRDSNLSIKHHQYLETVIRSGRHLLALINDVLDMSKIEAGQIKLKETEFNLFNLLDNLEHLLRMRAESKGLKLEFERDPHIPQLIVADSAKLRQVLLNLLDNGIKFTEEGTVRLRVERAEPQPVLTPSHHLLYLRFEVGDTGPGISEEERDQLFEPFAQTKAGLQAFEGTGLGLAISYQFVRVMGGELNVASEVGKGAIFFFDIPVTLFAKAEYPKIPSGGMVTLAADSQIYRILVADDDPSHRFALVEFLTRAGFEVRQATDGREAVQIWSDWHPHLIWMDMGMAGMDGFEATRRIRNAPGGAKTAIVALTTGAFDRDRQDVLSAGYDDAIGKPFQCEELLDKMGRLLGVKYVRTEV